MACPSPLDKIERLKAKIDAVFLKVNRTSGKLKEQGGKGFPQIPDVPQPSPTPTTSIEDVNVTQGKTEFQTSTQGYWNPSTAGYTERGGSFYKVFRTRKNYTSAQQTCEADGGHLAVANTEAINNFIVQQISGRNDSWIGLNNKNSEGTWMWADGTRLAGCAFSNWAPKQPSMNQGQKCVQMWSSRRYKWDNTLCHRLKYFTCQIGPGEDSNCDKNAGRRSG
ncbi:C-type lectin mannose-binding isoform-like [Branchiostoma floridae]|uniref:C-type lectin mannose-binding isoform-like n=1 Tax=Branchiostoma floridae TaxID=7739 RepID=A0A9J7LHM5_BRAFL|nr:C-type lectin mannose-binding isoform-like [Branchiostoma floridae]